MAAGEIGPIRVTFAADLRGIIGGFGSFSRIVTDGARSLRSSLQSVGDSISALGALSGTIGAAALAREFGRFDDAITAVRAVTKQTNAEFAETRRQVLALASALSVDATTAALGLNDIVQAGFNASDSLKILQASLLQSKAGLVDVATSSRVLIQVLQSFRASADDSAAIAGKLVKAVDLGIFTFGELAREIGSVAPIAKTTGLSLEELLATATTLTRQEANISEVATQIRQLLIQLLSPQRQVRAELEAMVGSTLEASVKGEGFVTTMRKIINGVNGSTTALARLFPEVRAFNAATKLLGQGINDLDRDTQTLVNNGAASLIRSFEIQTKSIGAVGRAIRANVYNAFIDFYERNRATFVSAAEAVQEFTAQNRGLLVTLAAGTASVAGLTVAVGALKLALIAINAGVGLVSAGIAGFVSLGNAVAGAVSSIGKGAQAVAGFSAALSALLPIRQRNIIAAQVDATIAAQGVAASQARAAALNEEALAAVRLTAQQQLLTASRAAEAAASVKLQKAFDRVGDLKIAQANGSKNTLALLRAQFDLQRASERYTAAQDATAAAVARVNAAQTTLANSTAAVTKTTAEAALASRAYATAVVAANLNAEVATARLSNRLRELFPTFAALGTSVGAFGARLRSLNIAGITASFATLATSLRAGLAAVLVNVRALFVGLVGPIGLLVAKLALLSAAAYVFYRAGRAIRDLLSGDDIYGTERKRLEKLTDELTRADDASQRLYQSRLRNNKDVEQGGRAEKSIDLLRQISEAAKQASAGVAGAAERVRELQAEFAKINGQTALSSLESAFNRIQNQIASTVEKSQELGQFATVRRNQDASVAGFAGDVEQQLVRAAAAKGEDAQAASDLYAEYLRLRQAVDEYRNANSAATASVREMRSANSELAGTITSVRGFVGELTSKLDELEKTTFTAGLDEDQRKFAAMDETVKELTDSYRSLQLRREEIAKQLRSGGDNITPENRAAAQAILRDIESQQQQITRIIQESNRQRDQIVAEAEARRARIIQDEIDKAAAAYADYVESQGNAAQAIELRAEQNYRREVERINALADLDEATRRRALEGAELRRQIEIRRAAEERDRAFRASDEGRRAVEVIEAAQRRSDSAREAAQLRQRIEDARKIGDTRLQNELTAEYIRLLEQAGDAQAANAAKEKEAVANVRERVGLLEQEIQTRLRTGQGAAGVADAARQERGQLAGASDAAGFRSAIRSTFKDDPTEKAIEERRKAIRQTLEIEYRALEESKKRAKTNEERADIEKRQRDLVEQDRILQQEANRSQEEITKERKARAEDEKRQRQEADDAKKKLDASAPKQPAQVTPSTSGTQVQPNQKSQQAKVDGESFKQSIGGLTSAASDLGDGIMDLAAAVSQNVVATANKLRYVIGAVAQHERYIKEVTRKVEDLRFEGRTT